MWINLIIFSAVKYAKMHQQQIPSIGRNVLEFSCVSVYADYLSDNNKKFQVASTYGTNR